MDARVKKSGGEGGIRTPDTGFGPYNGLAIRCPHVSLRNANQLQSSQLTKF